MLRKYLYDSSHVIAYDDLHVEEDVSYILQPARILDRRDQILRNRSIPLVRVLWKHHATEESTWEREDAMRANYPELFNGTILTLAYF